MDRLANVAHLSISENNRRAATLRRLDELDWDFPNEASDSLFSDIHWHPCRFPAQIPRTVIARMTSKNDVVLDPFVGSGTTIVEAHRLGRKAIGVDLNPISCLMTKAKVLPIDPAGVVAYLSSTKSELVLRWDTLKQKAAPPTVQVSKWYTENTLAALERLWNFVNSGPAQYEDLLKAAFSAILMPACRETRHWGYVCDNTQPKSDRERDVRSLFADVLDKFANAYRQLITDRPELPATCEVINQDAETALSGMARESIDCFITSPPYFGVADYVKSQRLSMEWFEQEIEPLRRLEIGARSKRHRLTAGTDYAKELGDAFQEAYRILKPNGWGLVILGHSPRRESAKEAFLDRLRQTGFRLELEKVRQIRQMRRQFPSLRNEQVMMLRKEQ